MYVYVVASKMKHMGNMANIQVANAKEHWILKIRCDCGPLNLPICCLWTIIHMSIQIDAFQCFMHLLQQIQ